MRCRHGLDPDWCETCHEWCAVGCRRHARVPDKYRFCCTRHPSAHASLTDPVAHQASVIQVTDHLVGGWPLRSTWWCQTHQRLLSVCEPGAR